MAQTRFYRRQIYFPIFPNKIDLEKALKIKNGNENFNKENKKSTSEKEKAEKSARGESKAHTKPSEEELSLLTDDARKIILSEIPQTFTVDDAVAATGLDIGDTLSALTELEINGLIKTVPGARYEKI